MTLCRHHFDTKSTAHRKSFRYCVFCRCWKKACFMRNLFEMRRLAAEGTRQENLNAELITFLWCGRSSVLLFNAAALQLGYPDTAGSPNLFISKCSITERHEPRRRKDGNDSKPGSGDHRSLPSNLASRFLSQIIFLFFTHKLQCIMVLKGRFLFCSFDFIHQFECTFSTRFAQ